jgi:hypothetical protein
VLWELIAITVDIKTVLTADVRGNEIADELARDGSVLEFVGPKPALGVSKQDIRRRIRH